MKYITRTLERKFLRMDGFFKAILVTGARQVGKTTMLRHLAQGQNRSYVSLDNIEARHLAKTDPIMFFQAYKPPIIIDEVQYAPELFTQIKIICDGTDATGLFWLTASQQFAMMKNVRETLAGRIGILELFALSNSEKAGVFFDSELDFSLSGLQLRQSQSEKNDVSRIFEHIWRGGMPQVAFADDEQREEYYRAYTQTNIMRDVTEFGGITDTLRFGIFLRASAALVSEQVNYKTLAEAVGISQPTAKDWLTLLEGMGIVYLLRPYANSALKRLAKTPKLYFCDTGLAAHLSLWPTWQILMNGAVSGRFFENFVVMELLKSYAYSPVRAHLTYLRDANTKEIDVLVERENLIHPLEIKKTARPDSREVRKFDVLDKANARRGPGGIICMCEEVLPINGMDCFIPCNLI